MFHRLSFPLILVLSLSLSRCVRAQDGSADVGATVLRGVRLACAVVGAIPDPPAPVQRADAGSSEPSPAPELPPSAAPSPIPRNPFATMDAGADTYLTR